MIMIRNLHNLQLEMLRKLFYDVTSTNRWHQRTISISYRLSGIRTQLFAGFGTINKYLIMNYTVIEKF